MDIFIDSKLRIAQAQLPPSVRDYIAEVLEIPNVAREQAMKYDTWGWREMPETISLWGISASGMLTMPRGFLDDLTAGLNLMNIEYRLIDNRMYDPHDFRWTPAIDLHPWQTPAVNKILERQNGIWKAPAGSGKTVGILEAIRRHAGRSIVLVNTKDIMWQWRDRARKFLGDDYPVSFIGDGEVEISEHLTIAMVQTLHSRYEWALSQGFFDYFSFMCLDECHHATAETFNRLVDAFSSEVRCGVSATPDKTGDFRLASYVLGPIIHETYPRDVDTLIKPEVYKIPTNFNFTYRGKQGRRPSNYPQLVQALIEDTQRNLLIVKSIMIERDGHSLVISKRLEHLGRIAQLLKMSGYPHAIVWLTGQETNEERQQAVEIASERPCVILSTLAHEAFDIPRLDRLFLVFPQRNSGLITQEVGRIERVCEGKKDAKVFDFCDLKIGPLEVQWKIRRREVYKPRGYYVQTAEAEQIMEYAIR